MQSEHSFSCKEIQDAIVWLLDDEADANEASIIEKHVAHCKHCFRLLEKEGNLRLVLRNAAESMAVPYAFKNKMHDLIAKDLNPVHGYLRALPVAAVVLILFAFTLKVAKHDAVQNWDEIARKHHGNLPMDVTNTDVTSVQHYLSDRLPFVVKLPNRHPGFQHTLAGRVIQIGDQDAAYVRYDTDHGRASLIVYEDLHVNDWTERDFMLQQQKAAMRLERIHGYTAAHWRSNGLVYSLVTDLPDTEFTSLVQSFR